MTRNIDVMQIQDALSRLAGDESGQDLIEYALVAALVGLGAVTALRSLASSLGSTLGAVSAALNSSV